MCQPLAKGGKRCATHMHGSMAVVTHTSIVNNADEGVVRTVFRSLRQEGKNLPSPTPEEVESFAAEQRLRAQFDPRIEDERKRNTIVRRWGRTSEEKPDGGTFHAWKNTMAETARRYSHKAVAIGTASVFALSAAACSGGGGAMENTPAPTVNPSPSVTQSYEVPAGLEIASKDNDGAGEYSRVSLPDDSPVYAYNAGVVQPDVASLFSEQDISEAQRAAADFAVEEGVDSILVDSNRTDEWYEQNASKFTEAGAADVQVALTQREKGSTLSGLVDNDVNGGRTDYDIVTDGGPRISAMNIDNSNVFMAPNGDLAVEFQGSVTRRAVAPTGETGTEVMNFTQTYSLQKGADGQWLISGWNNSFKYAE